MQDKWCKLTELHFAVFICTINKNNVDGEVFSGVKVGVKKGAVGLKSATCYCPQLRQIWASSNIILRSDSGVDLWLCRHKLTVSSHLERVAALPCEMCALFVIWQ